MVGNFGSIFELLQQFSELGAFFVRILQEDQVRKFEVQLEQFSQYYCVAVKENLVSELVFWSESVGSDGDYLEEEHFVAIPTDYVAFFAVFQRIFAHNDVAEDHFEDVFFQTEQFLHNQTNFFRVFELLVRILGLVFAGGFRLLLLLLKFLNHVLRGAFSQRVLGFGTFFQFFFLFSRLFQIFL